MKKSGQITPQMIKIARIYQNTYAEGYGHMIPSHKGLAQALGVKRHVLTNLRRRPPRPDDESEVAGLKREMCLILEEVMDQQEFLLLEGGLSGEMNSNIVKLALAKHGYGSKRGLTVCAEAELPPAWTVKFIQTSMPAS